jgi:hypothetical protein
MGPDVTPAMGWSTKLSILEWKNYLLLEERFWVHTTQDHHLDADVAVSTGAHR